MNKKEIGKFIKHKRKEKNLSQSQLNKLLGYEENSIFLSRIERGVASLPEKKIPFLSQALDIPEQVLLKMFHPDMPGICYTFGEATTPIQIASPSPIKKTQDLIENKEVLDAIVFHIKSDFLEPIVRKNQKALVAYSASININDYILLGVYCTSENYLGVESFRKKNDFFYGITISSGEDYVVGQLVSKNKDKTTIAGLKDLNSRLIIEKKDIVSTARIIGVLF